jgi:Leucine-rich repeat (LRR) protein
LQKNLQILDVSGNQIGTIEPVSALSSLEEFWVRLLLHCPLPANPSNNVFYTRISPLFHFVCYALTWFSHAQASGNNVLSFDELDHLKNLEMLNTVYFEHNPIYGDKFYRKIVAEKLPRLTQIDASPVLKVGGPM